jgi:hypothetical protein
VTENNRHLSILTLNINGLNAPIKNIVWQTGLKNKPNHILLTRDLISLKKKYWLLVKEWKKVFQANGRHK